MGFCVLQSFGYSFIARGFNTGRIQSILVLPAPLSRRPGIQASSIKVKASVTPQAGFLEPETTSTPSKKKGGFLHLCQKIHLFRCKPNSRRACAVMKSSIVLPPGCQPYPLRYETAHNSFQMGRAVIPCRGQIPSN